MRNRTHDMTDAGRRVKASLNELIQSTEDLLHSTASTTGSEVDSVRSRLRRQLDNARELAREGERTAVERYQQLSSATDEYVHENAWKTVGMAALIGVLVGACLIAGSGRSR